MTELVLGLLGGGAAVQIINFILTLRQNRRRMDAEALGAEVSALEKTILLLYNNFEREVAAHKHDVRELQEQLELLRRSKALLEKEVARLRAQVERLRRSSADSDSSQLTLPL